MRNSLLLAVFLNAMFSWAQPSQSSLAYLGNQYLNESSDSLRQVYAQQFEDSLWAYLAVADHYGKALPMVKNLSVKMPKDKKFALYSWVVPKSNGEFDVKGILWVPHWKQPKIVLEDIGMEGAAYQWPKNGRWVGALCFDIQTVKHKRKTTYMIFGFRPGRTYHHKIVDALVLGNSAKTTHFGAKVFNVRQHGDMVYERPPFRLVFAYGTQYTAAVRFDPQHNGIITDHLVPSKPSLKGYWFAYGPDFTYDRFYWKKGKWHITTNYPLVKEVDKLPVNPSVPTTLSPGGQ